ncbi:type II toxin-antitoxin system VapC family toxin [Thiothrix nivea]|uniref:PilT protein domain protein n=1 Tax=Thiothrix nivea (strain ATCC 35100 / DSM 5205 / JP2) TaxID=870187 RepID=A0A656HHE4_THINJ|nr:type II toxin-antitoxin system VapC family toxin [Thiothrix nivea]EIJ34800.1 PilT protein domain protein [Thiothrix nivea DSM 5205]
MSKVILDTSALLAYLFEEEGSDKVAPILEEGRGVIGSANYAELVTKLVDENMPMEEILAVISSLELEFIPQDEQQARLTGELRSVSKSIGLSLGDRACLGLGLAMDLPMMTADRVWMALAEKVQLQCIR